MNSVRTVLDLIILCQAKFGMYTRLFTLIGGVATQKKPNATANFKFGTGFFRFFFRFFSVFSVFFGFSIFANFDWFNGFLLSGSFW